MVGGSTFFSNPSQIYPRDSLKELLSVTRKQLMQGNYFSIRVLFPGVSSSFSLGTGYKMRTLTSKCGFAIKPATNALGLVSSHPHAPSSLSAK